MAKRIIILTASVGSGHNIAAGVLEAYFRQAPDVEDGSRRSTCWS